MPGYDAATGLYLDTGGVNYPEVCSRPTLDDARSAIGLLQEAFCDFPWAHEQHDFSATLAALLSLVARYAIQGNVPLFAVRSTTRASGKGLLVDTISIIATGRHAPRWAQTLDEDEEHKRLVTVGLAGDLTIHIDNVAHPLGTGPLDLAITAETISGRILGTQKEIEVPMHVVFFASGNNMVFKGDMARRVVPIDLDPRMERPEERDNFTHPLLLSWVLEKRPRLLAAALTILRAYVEAGRPAQRVKPLGSFEQWSMLVRQALLWAGELDPCAGHQNIEAESDENFEKLSSLLETWHVCYQTTAKTLASVIYDASSKAVEIGPRNEWNDLRDALGAFDAKYDGKRPLGKPVSYALRAWKGRVIAGKRLVSAGKEHHAAQWQIELL
jgi:putative DNA primase/helicase